MKLAVTLLLVLGLSNVGAYETYCVEILDNEETTYVSIRGKFDGECKNKAFQVYYYSGEKELSNEYYQCKEGDLEKYVPETYRYNPGYRYEETFP